MFNFSRFFEILTKRVLGPLGVVLWSTWLYLIGMVVTVGTVSEDFLYPAKEIIHPQTAGYIIATITYLMILVCVYMFSWNEYKNRIGYWREHPYVKEAIDNNTLENTDDYKTLINPEEMPSYKESKRIMLLCPVCQLETTQRGHHCPICDTCVLRRDHHCYLIGSCVGIGNQRFFVNTTFWCTFGCLLFLGFHIPHLLNISNAFMNSVTDPKLQEQVDYVKGLSFAPYRSFETVFFCVRNSRDQIFRLYGITVTVTIVFVALTASFFNNQLCYIRSGYTAYELKTPEVQKKLARDGATSGDRFRLVFGNRWLLNIFLPNIWDTPVLTKDIAVNLFRPRNIAE